MFNKSNKSSSESAAERLRLVLIHDRLKVSANSSIISMIKKDIMDVISSYVEIDANNFSVDITTESAAGDVYESKLVANIPIKSIKHSGRDNY